MTFARFHRRDTTWLRGFRHAWPLLALSLLPGCSGCSSRAVPPDPAALQREKQKLQEEHQKELPKGTRRP